MISFSRTAPGMGVGVRREPYALIMPSDAFRISRSPDDGACFAKKTTQASNSFEM